MRVVSSLESQQLIAESATADCLIDVSTFIKPYTLDDHVAHIMTRNDSESMSENDRSMYSIIFQTPRRCNSPPVSRLMVVALAIMITFLLIACIYIIVPLIQGSKADSEHTGVDDAFAHVFDSESPPQFTEMALFVPAAKDDLKDASELTKSMSTLCEKC